MEYGVRRRGCGERAVGGRRKEASEQCGADCRMLDVGCWVLGVGCWVLECGGRGERGGEVWREGRRKEKKGEERREKWAGRDSNARPED